MTLAKAQRAPRKRIKKVFFASWRPFGGVYPDKGRAEDMLDAKNFVGVVLLNILSVRI